MSPLAALIVGSVLLVWGGVVVAFPQLIVKIADAAEKARLGWMPQAKWGSMYVRAIGTVLAGIGLGMVVAGAVHLL